MPPSPRYWPTHWWLMPNNNYTHTHRIWSFHKRWDWHIDYHDNINLYYFVLLLLLRYDIIHVWCVVFIRIITIITTGHITTFSILPIRCLHLLILCSIHMYIIHVRIAQCVVYIFCYCCVHCGLMQGLRLI